MNAAGLDLVKRFEGFRDRAYKCPAGVWTIGYGFTAGVCPGDCIAQDAADARLLAELAPFESRVRASCIKPVTEDQVAAMTALAYNIGLSAFGRSTVLLKVNAGLPHQAADAFALWNCIHGMVSAGLTRRREAERALFLAGLAS